MSAHHPVELNLSADKKTLEILFADERRFAYSSEYLRVHSPSSQVAGYHSKRPVLQYGKRDVLLTGLQQVGHYAVKLIFDDGHDSGLFTWNYLYDLGDRQNELWARYLVKLERAGKSRQAGPAMEKPD